MRPLRVCFVSFLARSLFDPCQPEAFGGAELQAYLLARELAKDDAYEVHFLFEDLGRPVAEQTQEVRFHYLRLIRRGLPIVSPLINQFRWLSTLRSTSCDVFVQSAASGMTGQIARFCRMFRKAFVYWMASDGDIDGSILTRDRERGLYLYGLKSADAVFALSRYQQSELMRLHGKPSTILPNAFPVPDAPPTVTKDTVLWVASSQNLKQPWLFLELARAFPRESFMMIMPRNDIALWERIAAEAADIANLTFIEQVPLPEIQRYFDSAKVFINTSTIEGFPNTFVQSAIGATPVLSLNVNPDEVLTDNGFGRCAQGEYERLSADLGELLQDDVLRSEMGCRAFEYAKRTHDIKSVIRLFEQVLQGVSRG